MSKPEPPRPKAHKPASAAPPVPSDETTEVMALPAAAMAHTGVTLADLNEADLNHLADLEQTELIDPRGLEAAAVPEDPNKAYVAPREIPQAKLPDGEEDRRVVLNLPDQSAIVAPSPLDLDRARRRAPTVKVARGTLQAQAEDGSQQAAMAVEPVAPIAASPAAPAVQPVMHAVAVAPIPKAPPAPRAAKPKAQARSVSDAAPAKPESLPGPPLSLPSSPSPRSAASQFPLEDIGETTERRSVWPRALIALMAVAGIGGVVVGLRSPTSSGVAPGSYPATAVNTAKPAPPETLSPAASEPAAAGQATAGARETATPEATAAPTAVVAASPALDLGAPTPPAVAVRTPPPAQPTAPASQPARPPMTPATTKPGGSTGASRPTVKTDVPSSI